MARTMTAKTQTNPLRDKTTSVYRGHNHRYWWAHMVQDEHGGTIRLTGCAATREAARSELAISLDRTRGFAARGR